MKVILQQNVEKFGKAGDVMEATPGYFRNYLQPRKLAVVATQGTLKKREEDLAALRKKAETAHQAAVELGQKVSGLGRIQLTARAGDGGKLYGKITNKEIAHSIQEALGIPIDKRSIKVTEDINALGSYQAQVKLTAEVVSEITVEVQEALAK